MGLEVDVPAARTSSLGLLLVGAESGGLNMVPRGAGDYHDVSDRCILDVYHFNSPSWIVLDRELVPRYRLVSRMTGRTIVRCP